MISTYCIYLIILKLLCNSISSTHLYRPLSSPTIVFVAIVNRMLTSHLRCNTISFLNEGVKM